MSRAQIKEVKRNLKTLASKYEIEDAAKQEQTSLNASEKKKKAMDEWILYRVKCQAIYESKNKLRDSLLTKKISSPDSKIVQEWVEDEVIEEITEELEDE